MADTEHNNDFTDLSSFDDDESSIISVSPTPPGPRRAPRPARRSAAVGGGPGRRGTVSNGRTES